MYSVDDRQTFDNLHDWIESAKENVTDENVIWTVVGNKYDLQHVYVEEDAISALCDTLKTRLKFHTSAKSGENVHEALESTAIEVHRRKLGRRRCNHSDSVKVDDSCTHNQGNNMRCCPFRT